MTMDFVWHYLNELIYLLNEMAPWLLLGLVFAGVLKVYFPEDKVTRYMGKPNARSAVNASLLGIPMPLCSCGVIPTGISFFKNGASKGAANSFLISTPQTGIDSIFATYSMLGWIFALLRPVVAFTTGIIGGILTNLFVKEKKLPQNPFGSFKIDPAALGKTDKSCEDDHCGCHEKEVPKRNAIVRAAHYAFIKLLQDIAKWLIIGFLIAALISVLLPDDFFSSFKGWGILEILIILAASVPIYICATGSIPIATVLLLKGVSPGAALVFLMAGPATNVATMTVIGSTMGRKSLYVYLGTIIIGATIFGLLINWLIPADLILGQIAHIHGNGEHEMLPYWLQVSSTVILVGALVLGYFYERYKKSEESKQAGFITLKVEGMTCSHCEASMIRNLLQLKGISQVLANYHNSEVRIKGEKIDWATVEKRIAEIGYQFKGKLS